MKTPRLIATLLAAAVALPAIAHADGVVSPETRWLARQERAPVERARKNRKHKNDVKVEVSTPSAAVIVEKLGAAPRVRIERNQRVSVQEFKRRPELRRMAPSIEIQSINFAFGSADIPYSQYGKVQQIAEALRQMIYRRPGTTVLLEGHTDAVGSDVDNLSLSDRRAQAAAELLTQQFQVPPENLVTQGYGEQYLKAQTDGPARENRRVTVRRITPLLDGGTASAAPPPPPRR